MTDEIDLLRSANFLLREYGAQEAAFRAGLRADACLQGGDIEGHHAWSRILNHIEELGREVRGIEEALN